MAREEDKNGVWLPSTREAFAELRARATQVIAVGDSMGRDLRQTTICLRDESGRLLFEGTMEEAQHAAPGSELGKDMVPAGVVH